MKAGCDGRERERLRSERRRRAAGIMPRKPAVRPWLAMGISRSTYYRRRAKERAKVGEGRVAIARTIGFYVSPPWPDRCDMLVAELSAILARGQAALEGRTGA
jgi:hypothetical protein